MGKQPEDDEKKFGDEPEYEQMGTEIDSLRDDPGADPGADPGKEPGVEPGVEIVPSLVTRRDSGHSIRDMGNFTPTINEQRLLDVLLDPFHRMTSVSRQCEIAGVSRMAYYRAFQNPAFVDFYKAAVYDMIKAQSAQLVNIGIREARKGSYPHWKVLMEMSGFYQEKGKTEIDGNVTIKVSFADPDDD